MPTINDLIKNFESAANGLKKQVEDNLLITANDAVDSIDRRVQEQGKDANEQPFRDYTPQYKLFKAGLTKKKIERAKKKIDKTLQQSQGIAAISDKSLNRSIGVAGRYRGFVDLTLTGAMMRSLGVHGKNSGNGMASVTISVSEKERKKLEDNEKKRPGIIELSKKEKRELEKDFNKRNEEYFKNKLKF